jgi:transcriptional regulator with XRE-family HTH domain
MATTLMSTDGKHASCEGSAMALFTERLQLLADRSGLTQAEITRRIATAMDAAEYRGRSKPPSQSTVARFLAGESMPRVDQALFLARLFSVTLESLIDPAQPSSGLVRTLTPEECEIVALAQLVGHGVAKARLLLLPAQA